MVVRAVTAGRLVVSPAPVPTPLGGGKGRPTPVHPPAGPSPTGTPAPPPATEARAHGPGAIFIFVGYSGARARATPRFPDGVDPHGGPARCAATLRDVCAALHPGVPIQIHQTWSKDAMLATLVSSPLAITQVHVIAHGDAFTLDFARAFDAGRRRLLLARQANVRRAPAPVRAAEAMKLEDALVAGHLTHVADADAIATLRAKHRPGASWQLWGAPATPVDRRAAYASAEVTGYLQTLSTLRPPDTDLAAEVAQRFGVPCTTSIAGTGRQRAWSLHGSGRFVEADPGVDRPDGGPQWLWNPDDDGLFTVWPDGARSAHTVLVCGLPHALASLTRLPTWLTDVYWSGRGGRAT